MIQVMLRCWRKFQCFLISRICGGVMVDEGARTLNKGLKKPTKLSPF